MQAPQGLFFLTPDIIMFGRFEGSHRQKECIRLKNQSCGQSPVVWKKHRSKWSQRLGSRFFWPLFEQVLLQYVRNKTTPTCDPKKSDETWKSQKSDPEILSPTPFSSISLDQFFMFIIPAPYFCIPLIGPKIMGFLVGRTIREVQQRNTRKDNRRRNL